MKLTLKNLKQNEFPIEVESDKITVEQLKVLIENKYEFDSKFIKLLHSGVVLENAKTLEEYKIKDNNVIIMMSLKKKEKPQEKQEIKEDIQKPKEEPPKNEAKDESKYTEQINALVDMGYEKDKVEKAIKAANGSIDLAIEFLNSDTIPEPKQENSNQQQGSSNYVPGPVNPNLPEKKKKNAIIIKILCKDNPERISSILNNIKNKSPELFELIKRYEQDFKNLLVSPITQEDINIFNTFDQEMRRPGATIKLTREESLAVKRLQDLGNFSQAEAVQAYLACDKNEELAANFLFEQKMKEAEEGNNQNQGQNPGQ